MNQIKPWIKKLPGLRRILAQRDQALSDCTRLADEARLVRAENNRLAEELRRIQPGNHLAEELRQAGSRPREYVAPGHFFSPIPAEQDIQEYERDFKDILRRPIAAIDLHTDAQLRLLEALGALSRNALPRTASRAPALRAG
jgi:hypothetical protein